MSVTLESASRLNALKSKIDSALGTSSSTLSNAVDNALERGSVQIDGVYSGKVTVTTGEIYLEIDAGVTISDWAVFVMVGDKPPSFSFLVDRMVLLKEIVDGTIKWIPNRGYVTYSVLDSGAYQYTETVETSGFSTSGSRVIIEAHSIPAQLSGTYTWYLIQ